MEFECSCIPCKYYETSLDHGPCVSCRDHRRFESKNTVLTQKPIKRESSASYDNGYYGHEEGCDCAVCEDIAQSDLSRKIADAEWNRLLDSNAELIKENNELKERVEKWKIWYERVSEAQIEKIKAMSFFLDDVAAALGVQKPATPIDGIDACWKVLGAIQERNERITALELVIKDSLDHGFET